MSEPRRRERARRASFLKRSKGVLKKARELSILCDIPIGLALFGPEDTMPRTWPEDALAARRVFERHRLLAHTMKKDETAKFNAPQTQDREQEPLPPPPPRRAIEEEVAAVRGLEGFIDGKLEEVSARIALLKARAVGESPSSETMIPWLYSGGRQWSSAAAAANECDPAAELDAHLTLSLACPAATVCGQERIDASDDDLTALKL